MLASVGDRHNCEVNDVTARTDADADQKDTARDTLGAATSTRADALNFIDVLLYFSLSYFMFHSHFVFVIYIVNETGSVFIERT